MNSETSSRPSPETICVTKGTVTIFVSATAVEIRSLHGTGYQLTGSDSDDFIDCILAALRAGGFVS